VLGGCHFGVYISITKLGVNLLQMFVCFSLVGYFVHTNAIRSSLSENRKKSTIYNTFQTFILYIKYVNKKIIQNEDISAIESTYLNAT
jgi:hypothetical protein